MKPLRQPDAVTEALTASKAQAEKEPVKSDEGKEEKKSPSR
jgi:hypothetical protein